MANRSRPPLATWWRSIPWRAHLHLIAAVLGVIAVGLSLTMFLATRQRHPDEGAPLSPTEAAIASPAAISTQVASPVAKVSYPRGSLPALLSIAPDWVDDDTGLPVQATYADLNGWLEAQGLDPRTMDAAALREAIAPLALPEVVRTHGLTTQWRDMYGFDLGDVDAVLAVGQAPDLVLIMPGTYDRDALYAIWAANGYQAVEVEETTVWSLSPGDRIDLSAPVSQPSLGLMNTVVVLEDGTLIATARQSRMAATLRAVEGKSPSLLAHGALRDAMAIPEVAGTMSAMLASGSLLEVPQAAEKDAIATSPATAAAVMTEESPPPVELVLFTMTPAREGDAITMTLLYDDSPDAIGTVRDALVDHARADPVWSARYHIDHALVRGDRNLISVQVTGSEGRGIGFEIVDPRELTPFRWSAGT